ncbi:MAG: 6-phosphogluconolactonase [Sphingomonas sp.]|nr:6-phosphogluconolactonase [Sphingomonas sp.]
MADAVAGEVAAVIQRALEVRSEALLAFPGGSTPREIFERLAATDLPWAKVTIIPGDDRLVPADNPLSNVAELDRYFSRAGATVVPLASNDQDYRAAGKLADIKLHQISWPPDLVWLGMGMDGHTASIFPGPDLDEALNAPETQRAIGVLPDPLPPEAPVARVSLTKSAILAARSLLVTVRGQGKLEIIEQAIAQGSSSEYPIGRVLADAQRAVRIHACP